MTANFFHMGQEGLRWGAAAGGGRLQLGRQR
jgi:hypothetical protein